MRPGSRRVPFVSLRACRENDRSPRGQLPVREDPARELRGSRDYGSAERTYSEWLRSIFPRNTGEGNAGKSPRGWEVLGAWHLAALRVLWRSKGGQCVSGIRFPHIIGSA